jgi:ankyrin repeat protein
VKSGIGIVRCVVVTGFVAGMSMLNASGLGGALVEAVQNDDGATVAAVLKKHVDVNARENDGSTALAWASVRCNLQIATLLLKAGANPNLTNEQGIGPLYLAIANGSPAIVELLLRKGADPNVTREDGETPLMTATRLGQIDVMKALLKHGARVNAREKKFDQTALMWAAGHPNAMRLLIERGADVRAISRVWDITATIYTPTTSTIGKTGIPWNNDGAYTSKQGGQNALIFAVQEHDLESARLLLDAGVDVNSAAADGTTSLLASLYKWDPLGKEFVGGKGAPAAAGSSARFGADLAMARLLLDRGATIKARNGAGYTPLHGAALAVAAITTQGRDRSAYGGGRAVRTHVASAPKANPEKLGEALAMVKRLLDAGADPNLHTLYPTSGPVADVRINPAPPGSSAFHIAADSDCLALVKMLADRGANPNLLRKDGHTPFSVAVLSTDLPIVEEMVARGADLTVLYNPTDHFADPVKPISLPRARQTIMHIAAGVGDPEVIRYLYSKGVPLDAKNSMGETPLDLADHQERYREARAREAAEDKPERVVVRNTATTDAIKKLLATSTAGSRVASTGPECK